MKQLVVFPGLSSPNHQKYIGTYELLREQCAGRNIQLKIIIYPGQKLENGVCIGKLSPRNALQRAKEELKIIEDEVVSYRILGISFGCFVALASLIESPMFSNCERTIVWGPIAHWKNWKAFHSTEFDINLGRGSCFIHSSIDFLQQFIPIEYLIKQSLLPITIGVGGLDKHVEPEFLDYLKAICDNKGRCRHNFHYISDCSHNVNKNDPNYQEYINLIFS